MEEGQAKSNTHCLNTYYLLGTRVFVLGFPAGTVVKNLLVNSGDSGDMGSIPGSGRYPQGGNGNPLQHSCLGNPMDRGAWWARGHKESDMTEWRRGRPGENIHCLNTYYLLGTRVVAVYFPNLSLFF